MNTYNTDYQVTELSAMGNRYTGTLRKRLRKMTNRILATLLFTTIYFLSIGQVADFTHDFIPGSSNSCAPISISFTNTSTGASIYSWSINGISFSTSESPSRTFAQGGTYDVCLDASNGTTTNRSCQILTISEPAKVQITSGPSASCAPYATTIDISSDIVISSATIDYGNGVIEAITPNATTFSASHTYTQEGSYNVTVSAVDGNGCSSTAFSSNLITVRNVKGIGFTVALSNCQIPLTATFVNTTPDLANYSFDWDFGNGATANNMINASHFYSVSGSYDVALTATDLLTGCSDTYTIADAINSQSVTTIVAVEVDNGTCNSKQIDFSLDNLPANATVTWDFGDGLMSGGASTTHTYLGDNDCYIPTAEISTPSGCVFVITGTCIASLGPNDPSLTLSGDLTTCNPTTGTTVQHTSNSSKAVGWSWDFGDGNTSTEENPTHTYTGFGNYQPTLTTTYEDGCTQLYTNVSQTVRIANPTLSIVVDTARGCIPFDVNFSVVGSNDPIASIDWNFGVGATPVTVTDNTPLVSFGVVGDYDITAVVNTTSGCTYTVTRPGLIEVGDIPVVDFTSDLMTACVDSPIEFTDLSTPAGSVDEWEWDFGSGGSTEQNPTHEYAESDSFQVTLKAWYNGCPAEFLDTNYIQIGEPKSEFEWDFDCDDLNTINFTDNSTGADSIWWDFGDGSPMVDVANPTHIYPGEGTYTVTQYTKNNTTGCVDDQVTTINLVNPVAEFDIRDTTFCVGDVITITNLSTNIHNISWTIGGLPPGIGGFAVINPGNNGADAQIQFQQTQDYTDFTLNYSIGPNCVANRSITYNNTVRADLLYPAFTPVVDGCLPAQISVINTSIAYPFTDPSVVYTWQLDSPFGDTTVTGPSPVFDVDQTGIYELNLIMTNDAGCDIGVATPVNVNIDTTHISFDWYMINCDTREISFINTSTGITADSYEWDFGDGGTSNAATTAHQYAANGDYDVTFIVHTTNGCSDTLTQTIQVYDPIADFVGDNLTKSCPNPALITNFTNNSTGASSYEWDFGTGGTSTLASPSHAFSSVDSFDIKLIATSVNGCTDTMTRVEYIQVGGPFAELEYSTTESCTGAEIEFIVKGDGVAEYTWDFGDGNALTSIPTASNDTISFAYAVPGQYQPILIAEDLSGCRISYVGTDSINVFDLTIDFTADNLVMCNNDLIDVQFTSQISNPSAIDSIRWFFPGSDTPTALGTDISGVSYTTTNQYDVTMIAYTSVCADTLVKTAYIEVFDPPSFTPPAAVSVCNGSSVQLDILDGAGLVWSWDNSASLSCDDCPNPFANPTTTTTYTITGSSPGGCFTTRTVTVSVDEPGAASIPIPTISICTGRVIPISLKAGASNATWATTSQTLLCTNCVDQEITVDGSGTVDVSYDYLSCRITETLVIDAWDPETIDESANSRSICPGDVVDLDRPSYPGTIEWRADDINSAPLSGTLFTPTADTRYYIAVSYYGCIAIDSFDITIDQPSIMISPDVTICIGDTEPLLADGGPSYSYEWNTAQTGLSCYSCPNPDATPTTTTTYEVTADNGNGCIATETVTVTVNDITSDELPDSLHVCIGDIETLTLPADISNVSWTSTLALTQTTGLTTDVTASGSANVQVTYERDFCIITETININVWDPATVDAGPDDLICEGAEVVLPTNFPGTVLWRAGSMTATPIVGDRVYPTTPERYYLEVMNHGCTAVDSFDIEIDLPSISASGDVTICIGDDTQLTVSGDVNISSFVWDNTIPGLSCYSCLDPIASPLTTSSYVVLGTNANGCAIQDTVVVTVNDITSDELPDSLHVCIGATETLTLPADVSNVSWTSTLALTQTTGLTTDVTASGSADVQVTYERDFCIITETININVWDPATVDAGPDDLICQGEEVVLPTNYPGTIVWRAGSMTATPIPGDRVYPAYPVRYYVEVTNHGCTAVDSFDITIDLPSVMASPDTTICLGESTPLTVSGDANINTYVWENNTPGLSCYPCFDPIATPITTSSYVVVATNTNGCIARDTVLVIVNDSIPNFLADTVDVCVGDVVPFAMTGVTNVSWVTTLPITTSNGDFDADITASDSNYVDVTYDWNTCTYTERIIFQPWDPITVDAGQDQLVCEGQQVVLPLSLYGSTIWRAGSPTGTPLASNIINPTTPTTYYMEVSYNGCTGQDDIFIDIDLPTITTSGDITICIGESIPLTVSGAAGNTYLWSPSFGLDDPTSATPSANPSSDITYTVTGTNTNNCTVSEQLTVTVSNPQSDILGDTLKLCLNALEQINILPNPGTTNIQWSTNIPGAGISCLSNCYNPTFTAADSGTITLTYDYEFCSFTETIYIDTWDPSTLDAGVDQLICLGDTVALNTNYDGIVEWREGSLTSPALFVYDVHPDVSTWYYLSVTRHGCTGVDSLQIRLNLPTLEVDQPDPICVGTTIPLFVRGVSDPSMTFEWDGSQQGLSCLDCDNPDATPSFTSTYTVTGTNSFGCSVSEDVTVIVDQDTVDLMPDTIYACINSTLDILLDIVNNPGVDTNQIFWQTNIPIDCQCYHPQLSVDQSGPMTLNYRYNSCNKREDVYVVAWDPASVDAGADQTICAGEEIQLDRNYPGNVQWYFDSMTSASLTGSSNTPTQSGRYYLRVDNTGCFGLDSMNVTVLPNADISGGQYSICEGDSVQVDVVGSADAILFNNANSISDPTSFSPWASPTITTTYIIVGNNNGCAQDTATIEVIVHENPSVDMRLPAEFIEGDEIRLQADVNATDDLSYIWSPGDMIDCTSCQLPLFTPTATTLVSLTVIDDNSGCMAVDTATITQKFICSDDSIDMASAFSPNNDGINDHIKPVSLNQITDFQIFNRWGELVFQSNASGLGWDGVYKGVALKRGVYVYIAEGVCRFDGRPLTAKGDFMLIR